MLLPLGTELFPFHELAQGALLLHGDLREEHDAYLGGHRVSISADSLDNLLVISYAPGGSYTALVLSR